MVPEGKEKKRVRGEKRAGGEDRTRLNKKLKAKEGEERRLKRERTGAKGKKTGEKEDNEEKQSGERGRGEGEWREREKRVPVDAVPTVQHSHPFAATSL